MAALTVEQKAQIAKNKEMRDLGQTFKKMFDEASNSRDLQTFVELYFLFVSKPEVADMFVMMAKEYEKFGRVVDLRMQAGHAYLLNVADEHQTLIDDKDIYASHQKLLDVIDTNSFDDVINVFKPLVDLSKEKLLDSSVVELVALSFVKNHPTLQQLFLSDLCKAAQYAVVVGGLGDNKSLRKIASQDKAMPYI
ncbi:hypothetical protein [Photobacterium damselae]|uniref:hypothetical protein n=1 Tax=Photobacterium damselae TaxID=38293 RepID=UPI001F410071|nr:hypothetical protein [Photobacterium damselae]UKA04928.1 hypothetical protein IHC89_22040 [Photobacterium damselae subsp. damselae]